MTTAEVEDVIHGVERRQRASWEQTRILAGLYYSAKTGEEMDWEFPWDDKPEPPTQEEMDALRERAKRMEVLLNKRKTQDGKK